MEQLKAAEPDASFKNDEAIVDDDTLSDCSARPNFQKRRLVAPATLKSLHSWTESERKKKKKSKKDDDSWNEGRQEPTKSDKSRPISSSTSSSPNSSDSEDKEKARIPIKRKKVTGTKETNKMRQKRLANEQKTIKTTMPMATTKYKTINQVTKDSTLDSQIAGNLVNEVTLISQKINLPNPKSNKISQDENPKSKKASPAETYHDDQWDIIPNMEREYKEQKRKITKVEINVEEIINHRKGKNFRGELLVLYTTGQREWCYLHGVLQEVPQKVMKYMENVCIDYPMMGYDNLDPDLLNKDTDCPHIFAPEVVDTKNEIDCYDDEKESEIDELKDETTDSLLQGNTSNSPTRDLQSIAESENEIAKESTSTAAATIAIGSPPATEPDDAIPMDDTQNDSEEEFVCSFDHSDFHQLLPESDSRYCFNDRDFDGVHCAVKDCNKLFVHSTKGHTNCFKPSDKRPLYACVNRRDKCPYALCFACHSNLLLNYVRK